MVLHTTSDPKKAELEEVPMQAMEDNNEGQPEREGIVNVFLE